MIQLNIHGFKLAKMAQIHIHKWELLNETQYENDSMKLLKIVSKRARRKCRICGKEQELDIHCLGVKPLKYIKTWFNVKESNNNNYNCKSIW